ncbi:diguanylate cyclase [Thalassotalea euphylliae]|uniref:sensor domain-containing diguanylate cyclase n=1 Tax=Thalassotalea euphylliae TaxID=1655234 RepID=UPI00363384E3
MSPINTLPLEQPRLSVRMMQRVFLSFFLTLIVSMMAAAQEQKSAIELSTFTQDTIGPSITYFQEKQQRLTLEQAKETFDLGFGKGATSDSISLGIGVAPVWLKFTVHQQTQLSQAYRLAIETPWLDHIDTWVYHQGIVEKHVIGGDAVPFEQRPMQYKYYAFEHTFSPGLTDVYIRVESLGPMAIPVRLSTVPEAIERDISAAYQYGVLYGIMVALALYNLVLYIFIRQREYGLYSLYLLGFVINSLSYTGQLHTIITVDYGPYFQDWVDIFLMITYSVAGLHFARTLLHTKAHAPKLDQFVVRITVLIPAGMVIGFVFDQLVFATSLAFILNCGFVTLFIAMGIYALKANRPFAVIFLFSSVTAAICITISTLAVAGVLVPYNDVTFKAIEAGMAFEAILLAVILAQQFRMAKVDKMIAERYARTDPLTQVNNRHGFQDISHPLWQKCIREQRDASIVLLDIDAFKSINDTYGHQAGDKVLQTISRCIKNTARKCDVIGRWGGEEFILFLPETSAELAMVQAERLRTAIAALEVQWLDSAIRLTASFGVAGTNHGKLHQLPLQDSFFERMITEADNALYRAKHNGKNQVKYSRQQAAAYSLS